MDKPIKILQLSGYFQPEQVSSSHLSKDLRQAYLQAGFTFEYIVPVPTRGVSAEVRNEYKKKKYEELENGRIIVRRFSMFGEKKNTIQRTFRYACVNIRQYFRAVRAEGIDVLLSASTPPTQGLLFGKVKKKLSRKYGHPVPFVYVLQDIFPDSLVNAGMTKRGSIVWKIGRKIEDYTYCNADKIIVISEDFKKNIMAKGVPEEKIVLVPNWVNTDEVFPVKREDNTLFDKYGMDRSKFYVTYCGNIGHSQNMDMLLDAAKELALIMPELHFVLVGEGAAKESTESRIRDEAIGNVTTLPFQDYKDISQVFSLGDVGLIISKPGIGDNSVPSKTWSILAAEKPILASFDSQSDLANLIQTVGCGLTAEAGDKEALIRAIAELYENRAGLAEMGKRGRTFVKTELDKDKCVGEYVKTIMSVV